MLPKMSNMFKHLKLKIKTINLCLSVDEKLLEKYKTIWIKTEDLKHIEVNAVIKVYIIDIQKPKFLVTLVD